MIDHFFYIGALNQLHFLNHGVPSRKMSPSLYGTVDPAAGMTEVDKRRLREEARKKAGIAPETLVVGFAGKFIGKKNPELLFEMLPLLDPRIRRRLHLYFVGSGELEAKLRQLAEQALTDFGVHSHFAGFVNQSQLSGQYCAMDIFVLPSRRMGETWGLVVNEAMAAGLPVLVSNRCGCFEDLVFEGINGFGFDPANQKQLTDLMLKMSSKALDLKAMGQASLEYIQNYSPEYFARSLKQAIDYALSH
jgi:glycosyltransferase involved in cell wall biosynthesis